MAKIILAEDEKILADFLEKKLKNEGYEVKVARDGEEALKLLREEKPDLLLLDVIMPKKGGFEVLEEIRKDENLKDLNVIIISNSGQPVEINKAMELGVKDYIIKTEFDPLEVIEKVKKYI